MATLRIRVPAAPVKIRASLGTAPAAVKLTVPSAPVRIGVAAMPGPRGADGLQGFDFIQASAAALWIVNHNLGRIPAITLFTPGGQQMMADVTHVSINQARVNFAAATTGSARAI